jgi:hypothetical protein
MRIAWFRDTTPDAADPLDDTASLIDELRAAHAIDVVVEAGAHDFVWRHALRPWDLCVYELDTTPAHHFVWAYLLNYPGIVLLKSPNVQTSWGHELGREGRLHDYIASLRVDEGAPRPPLVQVPLFASRIVVVTDATRASELQEANPAARVRFAPTGVRAIESAPPPRQHTLRVAVAGDCLDAVRRAAERAGASGADVELIASDAGACLSGAYDVLVALTWPPSDASLTPVLAGMAAGRPVVTLEVEATADWPALDPQTWQPRDGFSREAPIAVTIDPRDEEHSLALTLRRLAADAELRDTLGRNAKAWWALHATTQHAASAWNQILDEAATLAPPPRPANWPRHLGADGTELTRGILAEFDVTSDLLPIDSPVRS